MTVHKMTTPSTPEKTVVETRLVPDLELRVGCLEVKRELEGRSYEFSIDYVMRAPLVHPVLDSCDDEGNFPDVHVGNEIIPSGRVSVVNYCVTFTPVVSGELSWEKYLMMGRPSRILKSEVTTTTYTKLEKEAHE